MKVSFVQPTSFSLKSFLRAFVIYAVISAVLAVCLTVPIDYVIYMPGKAYALREMIEVPDGISNEGSFLMTVVLSQQANIPLYIRGVLTPGIDIYPLEQVRPASLSEEEYQVRMLQSMLSSQEVAAGLALRHCGYTVREVGEGVRILSFIEGNKSQELLKAGDVIIACDEQDVMLNSELSAILREKVPGDTVTLVIIRDEEELSFLIELVSRTDNPEIGAIGISVTNVNWHLDLPMEINVLSEDIGGSSAGLMMTLEIINQLTEEDLTAGKRIAGSGTIDINGNVGAIGGVRQKVLGAINNGADYFLTPKANYQDALGAAGNQIEVVEVSSLADALLFLEGIK